jgi:protein-L-isoaspartate(D-aspartate) O-methyltransferase
MTPPEDREMPEDITETEAEVLEQIMEERSRLADERRVVREERRRQEKQFAGVVLICAVVCFAIGVGIAMLLWRPAPSPASASNSNAVGLPAQPATQPEDPAGNPVEGSNPGPDPAEAADPEPAADAAAYDIRGRDPVPIEERGAFIEHMVEWRGEERQFLAGRWDRYQKALEWGDLTQRRVKEAFLATPREKFCREWNLDQAYDHAYLDIHYGVTISGPHIVCRMTNALNPQPEHRCLEIGTGSGYQAAMLANLSNHVYSVEIIEPLAKETMAIYEELREQGYDEYKNVHLKAADGYYGWSENAPFDRIIVTCGIDHIPPPLLQQLAPNGVMVIPIGTPNSQKVLKITKKVDEEGEVELAREDLYPGRTRPIVFVPFTAEGGGDHYQR